MTLSARDQKTSIKIFPISRTFSFSPPMMSLSNNQQIERAKIQSWSELESTIKILVGSKPLWWSWCPSDIIDKRGVQ